MLTRPLQVVPDADGLQTPSRRWHVAAHQVPAWIWPWLWGRFRCPGRAAGPRSLPSSVPVRPAQGTVCACGGRTGGQHRATDVCRSRPMRAALGWAPGPGSRLLQDGGAHRACPQGPAQRTLWPLPRRQGSPRWGPVRVCPHLCEGNRPFGLPSSDGVALMWVGPVSCRHPSNGLVLPSRRVPTSPLGPGLRGPAQDVLSLSLPPSPTHTHAHAPPPPPRRIRCRTFALGAPFRTPLPPCWGRFLQGTPHVTQEWAEAYFFPVRQDRRPCSRVWCS